MRADLAAVVLDQRAGGHLPLTAGRSLRIQPRANHEGRRVHCNWSREAIEGLDWRSPKTCKPAVREGLHQGANPDAFDRPGMEAVRLDVTDPESVRSAAIRCEDVTLLVNNAGIGSLTDGVLHPAFVEACRIIFETNF